MNGFYNNRVVELPRDYKVVIPLRMNGFYNQPGGGGTLAIQSCHTAPNERLLQLPSDVVMFADPSCHTAPNERLLQQDVSSVLAQRLGLSYRSE